ncbi:MAG: glycine cleavage system aminomethyltransferase GcvT, partial [Ancalomicrobiaceae bacterium]|nr:glycine cleavage system aminomethyltransferase GcvT [Ancalomicrobiaceae bacterium]
MSHDAAPLLATTPLHAWHIGHAARMVPFAGYDMPVQYASGVLKEHLHTRAAAGLFDVSHMGQARLIAADGRHETVALALEALIPADVLTLAPGKQRYSQFLDATGGILDDLMVSRGPGDAETGTLRLVVNAACKTADYAHMAARLPAGVRLVIDEDLALVAIQGPAAESVVSALMPEAAAMGFMATAFGTIAGLPVYLSRSGYTGEDGYEISVQSSDAVALWQALAAHPAAQAIGLGARDSLRLEAGLSLYGNDIDETTSPVEAGLSWSIPKRRREGG